MYRLVQYTDFHSLVSCLIHSTNTSNKVGALAYAALIAARQARQLVRGSPLHALGSTSDSVWHMAEESNALVPATRGCKVQVVEVAMMNFG